MSSRVRAGPAGAVAVLCVLLSAGCGGGQRETEAGDAAGQFVAAVEQSDFAAACALLSPRAREQLAAGGTSSCEDALVATELPVSGITEVTVWGERAEARTDAGPLFLAELANGWKVVAAGCRSRGADRPYSCVVRGT
jgi:hypothetical protein